MSTKNIYIGSSYLYSLHSESISFSAFYCMIGLGLFIFVLKVSIFKEIGVLDILLIRLGSRW